MCIRDRAHLTIELLLLLVQGTLGLVEIRLVGLIFLLELFQLRNVGFQAGNDLPVIFRYQMCIRDSSNTTGTSTILTACAMQIFQSAVQKLSLYPTRGKRTKINYRNSVTQYLALVKEYHLYIVSFCC